VEADEQVSGPEPRVRLERLEGRLEAGLGLAVEVQEERRDSLDHLRERLNLAGTRDLHQAFLEASRHQEIERVPEVGGSRAGAESEGWGEAPLRLRPVPVKEGRDQREGGVSLGQRLVELEGSCRGGFGLGEGLRRGQVVVEREQRKRVGESRVREGKG